MQYPPMQDPPLFETMFNMRAMRRLKPDPIPDDVLRRVIEAGTKAPSGQNTQPWAFLMLKDPAARLVFGELYRDALFNQTGIKRPADDDDSPRARTIRAARHLAQHMHEAPVIVLLCGKRDWPFAVPVEERIGNAPPSYGSIYPAAQNVLLACRGLGLGATLTTMHQFFDAELRDHFGIPQAWGVVATIPIGYPLGKFGPTSRRPPEAVTHVDRWGQMTL